MKAGFVEIMSSIQGEGKFVGCRQIFVRFQGCNLQCTYCDTPKSLAETKDCLIEKNPGMRDFTNLVNPISLPQIVDIIRSYHLMPIHSISYTGGEPLLHYQYLKELLPQVQGLGPKSFLETNGTLVDELTNIIDHLDYISMDLKLSDAIITPLWEKHKEFLRIAVQKDTYIKTVLTAATPWEDIDMIIDTISSVDKKIPLVLQPVTPFKKVLSPEPNHVIKVQDYLLKYLSDVRVIPQTHKYIGQL
jgi:7-carboxy-7-deazaguanine synthase